MTASQLPVVAWFYEFFLDGKPVEAIALNERIPTRTATEHPLVRQSDALAAISAVREEVEAMKRLLKDPAAVHVAMLRGEIAKPDIRSMLHCYGSEALDAWDSIEALRKDAERYRAIRNGTDESCINSVYPFAIWESTHWLKRGEVLDKFADSAIRSGGR